MNIGKVIKEQRKKLKLTQMEFSKMVGLSQTYVSQVEHGHKTISLPTLEAVCHTLKMPMPVLIWMSLEKKDVSKDKREAFDLLKPQIDDLISNLYYLKND